MFGYVFGYGIFVLFSVFAVYRNLYISAIAFGFVAVTFGLLLVVQLFEYTLEYTKNEIIKEIKKVKN